MSGGPPAPGVAVVAVGSNIDPEARILQGLDMLSDKMGVVAVSSWYRTSAVGPDGGPRDDPDFINGAVALETAHGQEPLRVLLLEVEAACGRRRGPDRYAPRTLDLDLVVHDGRLLEADAVTEGHVARPLADLARLPQARGPWADTLPPVSSAAPAPLRDGPLAAWRPKTL